MLTTGKYHGWTRTLFAGVRRLVVWGARRIREFNTALLRKWRLRLLEDRDSLWFRVMSTRYGVEGGWLKGGGRKASTWWRDVHALCREEWFIDHVSRSVGNRKNTLFWSDVWLGGVSFRVRFRRLFDLTVLKGEFVFDMWQLGWGGGGGVEVEAEIIRLGGGVGGGTHVTAS